MNMKQKMQYIQTLKQTLKLNQKLLKSLDFLTDNIDDINKVVQQVLETNPFLELKSPKNYDTQQFIESISNKRSLKDDLYLQLSACTRPYNEDLMDYLIESLDDSGFLSYPIDQYLTDLDIDKEMLDVHLDILRSFEPNGVGAADAIDSIIIHCSATRAGQNLKAKDIDRMHRARNFDMIGYHFVIDLDGTIEKGRPLSMIGAHCNTKGSSGMSYNKHSIGVCYIGGLNINGEPADTRTPAQKIALVELVSRLKKKFNIIEVLGHRDTSPDLNDNGIVEPSEWIKSCPCFDAAIEFGYTPTVVIQP